MAVIRGWTLSGAVVLALATGIPVGCGSDACALSCDAPHAAVRTPGVTDPITMEMCVDGDCEELEDQRTADYPEYGVFRGFDYRIPTDDTKITVTVRNGAGEVIASFDETRTPQLSECCGYYIAIDFDGSALIWRDV